jgi:hypothetical protein
MDLIILFFECINLAIIAGFGVLYFWFIKRKWKNIVEKQEEMERKRNTAMYHKPKV